MSGRPRDPETVLAVAKELYGKGLVEGTSGNVSARLADGTVCVTPSSLPYEEMNLEDLVVLSADGDLVRGHRSATSEKDLHLACYRAFPEVGGVIHSHPVYASMFACARTPIPACIEESIMYVGGEVAVCDYAMTGTPGLGESAVQHLADASAALLANHGMVSIGRDPQDALHVALVVERTAQIAFGARVLGGLQPLPVKTTEDFAGVYRYLRTKPSD
ncbi:MAG: class II aldolase/adducin family protein [Acidimicrobiales bacterium]|nr:class II aldolase/adducin family protein [Acidimicrobiales bacterium]MBO0893630.1 class II aldolase/adducin family protein [Acidimicrobiales bacterium]